MRIHSSKARTLVSGLAAAVLLLGSPVSGAQVVVNLTAAPTSTVLPDGQTVPMWGYSCAGVNDPVASIAVTNGGAGYSASPTVTLSPGVGGIAATATATVSSGVITAITISSNANYSAAPTVTITDSTGSGAAATASLVAGSCAAANPNAAGSWSPVIIRVPYTGPATSLTVNLTNSLVFATPSGAANLIPTSLMIVGQIGGGLGSGGIAVPSPAHAGTQITWPTPSAATVSTPPAQLGRVRSFGTEVAAGASAPASLTWSNLRPGTYLIESGSHPSIQVPMGLYGMVIVAPPAAAGSAAQAYPTQAGLPTTAASTYDADAPFVLGEIDPVQNTAVATAVATDGFTETEKWNRMNGGGPVTAIAVTAGGVGYPASPTVTITPAAGSGGSGATATATVGFAISSTVAVTQAGTGYSATDTVNFTGGGGSGAAATITVDGTGALTAVTVTAVGSGYTSAPVASIGTTTGSGAILAAALDPATGSIKVITLTNGGDGYSAAPTVTVSGSPTTAGTFTASFTLGGCGGGAHTCYPPAVDYSPRYYLVNGVSFDRTNLAAATTCVLASCGTTAAVAANTGNVLVRLVNAGLRMHVPSMVGLPFTLIAEDGNPLPGVPRVQNEVFLAAGKTYDVLVAPAQTAANYSAATYPLYDRQLSLSTNNQRDGGMQAYLAVAGGASAGVGATVTGVGGSNTTLSGASNKQYFCVNGTTLSVTDPLRGLLGGTTGANGVAVVPASITTLAAAGGSLVVQSNGTFTYTPPPSAAQPSCSTAFQFLVNGGPATWTATISECDKNSGSSTTTGCALGGPPVLANDAFKSNNNKTLTVNPPGVLLNDTDPSGLPLHVDLTTITPAGSLAVAANADGSFTATAPAPCTTSTGCTYTFTYNVLNSQQTAAAAPATVSVTFPAGSGLVVNLVDQKNGAAVTDYRWIIEEDRTFWIDPKCQVNSTGPRTDSYGRPCPALPVEALGYNFHTAAMPVVATGCVGALSCESGQTVLGAPAVCDVGDGTCRTTDPVTGQPLAATATRTPMDPSQVALDPNKHYFISVMPGDGINPTLNAAGGPQQVDPTCDPTKTTCAMRQFDIALDCPDPSFFTPGTGLCGHNMGGAQIPPSLDPATGLPLATPNPITIKLAQTPLPTAKISVLVYEDDYPLNGENDAGGGVDIIAPNEPGLGGFQIVLLDQAGGLGDPTGQPTYDMFNMPLTNSLSGMIDPATKLNACPITSNPDGMIGMIVSCPKYESDNKTLSPLAGQAVIANLYPGIYEIQAFPAADRIARGEEWLQTNTLDGGKPHEAFIRPNEPGYFQEFGPGGFHVQIGFANPKIINDRRSNSQGTGLCDPAPNGGGLSCLSSITGHVHGNHMSRTPDERTYDSGSYDAFKFSACYVSLGIPDAQDFAFAKCDADGNFTMTGLPDGVYKLAVFDQWNDIMLDGLITPVTVNGATDVTVTATQWRTNLYTRIYLDTNGNGIPDRDANGNDLELGAALLPIQIRYRDGSIGFKNQTDLNGYATYNEVFPFMDWLVVEPDRTRYKPTGEHVVYDAGGPDDCSPAEKAAVAAGGRGACSKTAAFLANTIEYNSLPAALQVPGAVYCTGADCTSTDGPSNGIKSGAYYGGNYQNPTSNLSSGRIDPPWRSEGWQGLLGQHSFIDFGLKPYIPGETGGITGIVVYASTRPFDDPTLGVQLVWEPGVPNVQMNLYKEDVAADGTKTLTLVDTTYTSSWDAWAQGFRTDGTGTGTPLVYTDPVNPANSGYIPNMNCPGQDPTSGFFATLQGSKMWLDAPDAATGKKKAIAYNSQFKCYDGWSQLNQIQPAPYDGRYDFPSVVDRDPTTGKPSGQGSLNGVTPKLAGTNCTICIANPDDGTPMLPPGKYVVEAVTPAGFEIVKEEDKNILMGDIYVAPVTQQFAGVGSVFILPDQAAMNAYYNGNNPLNPTTNLGVINPRDDFASANQMWPCVGQVRVVPDTMSLFPQVGQTAPFAGASRPLCDRKEVTLADAQSASSNFFVYTKNHIAGHFVGGMTNDMASEFDPFSPQFGEKFGVPNVPIRMRDFTGDEVTRVYGDQWGAYNGLYFSSWEVNPPNPTGYAPQMSIACMNDPGPILDTDPNSATRGQMITDPYYNPAYSNFCYETPFMPGFTAYMDTPVVPVQAFADHYNLPDAEYPDGTPVIRRVDSSSGIGPWLQAAGGTLTIQAYGDRAVQNPQYAGPSAVAAPYNQKTVIRHYGFGAQCTAIGAGCAAVSSVTIGGVPATINSWTVGSGTTPDTINVTVPQGLALCPVQQQGAASPEQCGELVITAGNGKQSIDGITVTVGGNTPKHVSAASPSSTTWGEFYANPLQTAIDAANPGDLIIVDAGTYRENLIMWKPVRLQGVGAGSVTINADAHPAGKMDAWRRRMSCLFGLTIQGIPNPGNGPYDTVDGKYNCPASMYFTADRIPWEGFIGWDAASNGNLAQVLQEPSLMGAYEGAGITVTGRGVNQSAITSLSQTGGPDYWGTNLGAPGAFADGSVYLSTQDCNPSAVPASPEQNYYTSNFLCNPSAIDGLSILNSSQGGGGIFMHAWQHNIQIANTRIAANAGTLGGGINVGQGETPEAFTLDNTLCGNVAATPAPLCPPIPAGTVLNQAIPFQFNTNVRIHHNQILDNASIGDALFSGTPSGAGGINVSTGSDWYVIDHNWIAANLTSGDGGGIAQVGVSFNGRITNNYVLFNQANNATLPVDGGGIAIMGAQQDRTLPNGQECGNTAADLDCAPGTGEGVGPGIVVDANLVLGNSAEDGSGGGLRLRQTNGTEVAAFLGDPSHWYDLTVTNNIIVNNVAGWDGGGVSLQDTFKTRFVNNTVSSNDTTASAGVLFKTLGAVDAASPPPGCLPTPDPTQPQTPGCLDSSGPHIPQPAGLVTMQNTPNMMAQFNAGPVTCPAGYGYGNGSDQPGDPSLVNGRCVLVSLPQLVNDIFWQNRAFHVEIVDANGIPVGGTSTPNGTGLYSQQNIVALLPQLTQTSTGQCSVGAVTDYAGGPAYELYWDVGVRMDASMHTSGHNLVFNGTTVGQGYNLGAAATATVAGGAVTAIAVTNGGAGYASPPTVSFTGGGGSGAAATATIRQIVAGVLIDAGGSGYTSPPTVTFTGGGGTGAAGTAVISAGAVIAVNLTSSGTGYTSAPTIAFTGGGGTGAVATANFAFVVTQVTVTNGGSGYTSAPFVAFSGGGATAGFNDTSGIALTTVNSILSDAANLANVHQTSSFAPAAAPVQAQYCNGARIPPEQCGTNQGANEPAMCKGYFAPAGSSEHAGIPPVFVFNGIAANATVDEGQNWINLTYGPLTLARPTVTTTTPTEFLVASGPVGTTAAAYSIPLSSPAVDAGMVSGAPDHDFFGNPRPSGPGVDIGAVEFPKVSLAPGSYGFGNQPVLTTSAVKLFTVSNPLSAGSAVTLTLPAVLSDSVDFAIASNNCPASLAAGSSCQIGVTFTPFLLGPKSGTLTLNTSQGALAATLTGTGTGPLYSVNPTSLTFPNTVVGTASAALTVTVRNNQATTNLTLTTATTQVGLVNFAGQYTVTANTCTGVLPGANCAVSVTFNPQTFLGLGGIRPANLRLTGSGLQTDVGLSATAILFPVDVTPKGIFGINGELDFAPTQVGVVSGVLVATLTNYQSTPVTFNSVTVPAPFRLVVGPQTTCTPGAVVGPNGGNCTIGIQFAPTSALCFLGSCGNILDLGMVTMSLTGSPVNPTILLTGTATPDSATLTGNTVFGNQVVSTTSAAQTLTYTNTSGAAITVTGVTKGGNNPTNFTITSNTCSGSLPAGGNCTLTVTFTPSAVGARSATVTVQASNVSNHSLTLSGTGTLLPAPAAAKAFGGAVRGGNGTQAQRTTTLTITLTNPNATAITGAGLTDNLPQPAVGTLTVVSSSTTCGGATSTANTARRLLLTGGTIPANGSCTVTATVRISAGATNGPYTLTNTIPAGGVTAANASSSTAAANATLTVTL